MTRHPGFPPAPPALEAIFGRRKVIIGMVHLPPLPGSPAHAGAGMAEITAHARAEAGMLRAAGMDGLIVENHGDIPFLRPADLGPETAACMAVVAAAVRAETGLPIGINVLANGGRMAIAVAKAAGAAFVRINQFANAYVANEGLLDGEAGLVARDRRRLAADDVRIFADVHVKHGAHAITGDRPIGELARDVEFFGADVAIATGQRTGDAAADDEIAAIAAGCRLPVITGSGATADNIARILRVCQGAIVASWLKRDGVWWTPIDPERLRAFMQAAEAARAG